MASDTAGEVAVVEALGRRSEVSVETSVVMNWIKNNWVIGGMFILAGVLVGVPLWADVAKGNELGGYASQGFVLLFVLVGIMAAGGRCRTRPVPDRDNSARLSIVRKDSSQGD